MGIGYDSYDPVVNRVLYFERIKRSDKEFMLFLPAYSVTYPGLSGVIFEPVDCMTRAQNGTDGSSSSQHRQKDVNEMREWDARAARCQEPNNPLPMTLHSFSGWPR